MHGADEKNHSRLTGGYWYEIPEHRAAELLLSAVVGKGSHGCFFPETPATMTQMRQRARLLVQCLVLMTGTG